jgi:hypothetical protein
MKFFKKIYFSGIILGIIFSIPLVTKSINQIFSSDSITNNFIVFFGVGHVIWLAVLGWKMKNPADKLGAGLRVQTAGYLHTLVGFTGALFQLNPDDLLNSIIAPLSYALLTSVFGWLFGGELVNDFQEEEGIGVEKEAKKVSRELRSFADEMAVIHRQYLERVENSSKGFAENLAKVSAAYERMLDSYSTTLDRLNTKQGELLEQLSQSQSKFIREQNNSYDSMNNAIEQSISLSYTLHDSVKNFVNKLSDVSSLSDNMSHLNEQTNLAAQSMQETADASYQTSQYLNNSRVLIEELEKVLESVAKLRGVY